MCCTTCHRTSAIGYSDRPSWPRQTEIPLRFVATRDDHAGIQWVIGTEFGRYRLFRRSTRLTLLLGLKLFRNGVESFGGGDGSTDVSAWL